MLANIRIVLVETSHPGNIGAAARAMKNMGLYDLALVKPRFFPHEEAISRASGADDVLSNASVHETLEDAVGDCHFVVGTSARLRTVNWPQFPPRACAHRMLDEAVSGKVALVMGRERSGLTNAEMDLCHYLAHIPTNPEYQSLNMAMAVQVMTYELFVAADEDDRTVEVAKQDTPATVVQLESFFDHLLATMGEVGFSDPRHSDKLFRRLRRMFHRMELSNDEVQIMRGVLSAVQGKKQQREFK